MKLQALKHPLICGVLLLSTPALAEVAAAPDETQSKTVIHLPSKPKVDTKDKSSTPPEAMAPSVKMAPPPAASNNLNEPSPAVPVPSGNPVPPKKKHAATKQVKQAKRVAKKTAPAATPLYLGKSTKELDQVRVMLSRILPLRADQLRATIVSCASERLQDQEKDLYLVKNAGNQLAASEREITRGVRELGTRVLWFIGSSNCAAIQQTPAALDLPSDIDPVNGSLLNVNNQIESAILTFSGEVEAGNLAIIGGFYDRNNELKQGYGRLIVTNVNGETDLAKIKQLVNSKQFFRYGFMSQLR